ncbi:MAG: hypothetical protein N4A76_01230 [Firmicutes bacterium]|nr:hypothetical protein [Bacillota bacterium]
MKKIRMLIGTFIIFAMISQNCYGITHKELKKKFGVDVDYSKMTWDEAEAFDNSEKMWKYEREMSNYIDYSAFSKQCFAMAGYDELNLERAEFLGYDKLMNEQTNTHDLTFLTKGNALRYLFIFNGYDTKGYEEMFEDKNLVTWEEAKEMTKGIQPFVWNEEFQNREMWSDEEFIDFVNNNPDASQYLWTENIILDGHKITINSQEGGKIDLDESYPSIPNFNDRIFNMLKILTFEAVKNGGTVTFYGNEGREYIYIGFQGRILNTRRATFDNFGIAIDMKPWEYRNKNTTVTIEMKRMYTANRIFNSGEVWSGIYPNIMERVVKELYRDSYSKELLDYFKKVVNPGIDNDEDVTIGEIDVFYMLDGCPRVYTKIK